MRYLAIIAILLVSMCTSLPEIPFINSNQVQQGGLLIIDSQSPDVFIRVDYNPEVKVDRSDVLYFELRNKNNFDLKDFNLEIYDPCIFTGELSKTIDKIRANRTMSFTLKLNAGKTEMDKDCEVRFKTSYNAENSLFEGVTVLTKAEYEQREAAGTLDDIPIQSSILPSPFKIEASFSEKQPFMENENYYLHLDYYNVGEGFVDVKNISIEPPTNVKDFECSNYRFVPGFCYGTPLPCSSFTNQDPCFNQGCDWDTHASKCWENPNPCSNYNFFKACSDAGCDWKTNVFVLNKSLSFTGNRAQTSSCSFTTTTLQPMDMKSLMITASYKYTIYNSISIRVKRK